MIRTDEFKLLRFKLSLSSFSHIVPWASHWWCRVNWNTPDGVYLHEDAEHGPKNDRTNRFETRAAATRAGLKLAHKLADGAYHVVTIGGHDIDPQQCLYAPGNLRGRLNRLWRQFEKLDGWEAPKEKWPKVQEICDRWSELLGEKH